MQPARQHALNGTLWSQIGVLWNALTLTFCSFTVLYCTVHQKLYNVLCHWWSMVKERAWQQQGWEHEIAHSDSMPSVKARKASWRRTGLNQHARVQKRCHISVAVLRAEPLQLCEVGFFQRRITFNCKLKHLLIDWCACTWILENHQGCDGSNLLDDILGFIGEKTTKPNLNLSRGFNKLVPGI